MNNRFINNAPIKTRGELRRSSTPLPEYACLHCRMDLCTSENLKLHAFYSDHFLQCGCCDYLLSTPEEMVEHLSSFSHKMKCAQCQEMFPTYAKWRHHMFRTGHRVWFDFSNLRRIGPFGPLNHLLPKDGSAITNLIARLEREKKQLAKEKAEYNIFADNEVLDPIELTKKLMKRAIEMEGLFYNMDGMEIDSERSEDESTATSSDSESDSDETEGTEYEADDEKDENMAGDSDEEEEEEEEEDAYSYIYMNASGEEIKVYPEHENKSPIAITATRFETAAAKSLSFTSPRLNKLPTTNHRVQKADSFEKSSHASTISRRGLRCRAADFFEMPKGEVRQRMRERTVAVKRERGGREGRRGEEREVPTPEEQSRSRNRYKQHWRLQSLRERNPDFAVDGALRFRSIS